MAFAEGAGGDAGHKRSRDSTGEGSRKRGRVVGIPHTAKEKLRRANIVSSCDRLRAVVPGVAGLDKASVFSHTVAFVRYIRRALPPDVVDAVDEGFLDEMLRPRT